jgi:leucyl/phenylalanyl-tRNA---protein transferase
MTSTGSRSSSRLAGWTPADRLMPWGSRQQPDITPELLLRAYACGIFPMAESPDDPELHWYEPKKRGILPLDGFHVSRSLSKVVRSSRFDVVADRDFPAVIAACASPAPGRENTWINATIRALYGELFKRGRCHTVEAYQDGTLVGGLYGVSIGKAFFGESMFHRTTDASKVALTHLVARLKRGGYSLLDAQFITNHLATFGAIEVERSQYQQLLSQALTGETLAETWLDPLPGDDALRLANG